MVGKSEIISNIDIKIKNMKLQHVKQFWYLGSTITIIDDCCTEEIKEEKSMVNKL